MTTIAEKLLIARSNMSKFYTDSQANTGKFQYAYLSLPGLLETVLPALAEQGLLLTQEVSCHPDAMQVVCIATRVSDVKSGEAFSTGLLPVYAGTDMQEMGKAITYGRRYQLMALMAVSPEDDDAPGVGNRVPPKGGDYAPRRAQTPVQQARPQTPPPPPPPSEDESFGNWSPNLAQYIDMWGNPFFPSSNDDNIGELVVELRALDSDQSDLMPVAVAPGKKVSMYGYLCSLIDQHVGKDAHGPVLTYLLGRVISKDTPPSRNVKELLDRLIAKDPLTLNTLKAVHHACMTELAAAKK